MWAGYCEGVGSEWAGYCEGVGSVWVGYCVGVGSEWATVREWCGCHHERVV